MLVDGRYLLNIVDRWLVIASGVPGCLVAQRCAGGSKMYVSTWF